MKQYLSKNFPTGWFLLLLAVLFILMGMRAGRPLPFVAGLLFIVAGIKSIHDGRAPKAKS